MIGVIDKMHRGKDLQYCHFTSVSFIGPKSAEFQHSLCDWIFKS